MESISGSSDSYVTAEDISFEYEEISPPKKSPRRLEDVVQVQHGFFTWSVENISNFPDGEGITCYSPTFKLKETWWYLALRPNSIHCGRDCISMGLVRHSTDSGPENVVASYNLGLENSTNKIWFKAEENVVFQRGDSHGMRTSVLGNLKNFLSEKFPEDDASDDNRLLIICEIYTTYFSNEVKKLEDKVSPIDLSLSSDLVALFENQKKVDVLIEIRNHSVWVHKSVLCARSRTLARLLEGGKFFIQLSCSLPCLTCAIAYMYSGSFEHLVMKATFCVGLYELACDLCLPRLRDLLNPHRIEKRSRVEERLFKRTCTIYEFNLEELSKQKIETTVGFDEESSMSAKIILRKLDSPPECVAVDVEIGGVAKVFHLDLSVSFLNKNFTPFKEVVTDFLPGTTPEFRDSKLFGSFMISNSDLQSSITNGNLFINVRSMKYVLRTVSNLPANLSSLECSRRNWIEELSEDFDKLFKSGKLSDIMLIAGGRKFRVHRSILAARSRFFHMLFFERSYLHNALGFKDVEPRILSIVLKFVYCGRISQPNDLTEEDILKLRRVADKFRIQSLLEICDHIIEVS